MYEGKIAAWFPEKGFGFIRRNAEFADAFCHISKFPPGTVAADVQRGMAVGSDLSTDVTKLPPEEQARIRKILYNQRARPTPVA